MRNVLLLAMSKLSSDKPDIFKYIYQDEATNKQYLFWGISQLEAGTKLVLTQLAERNEKLDKIIVLNTEATLDEKNKISPYDFYKKRIKAFIKKEEYNPFGSEYSKAVKEANGNQISETTIEKVTYSDDEIEKMFEGTVIVDGNNTNFYLDAVSHIVGEKTDEEIALFQNMQGGDRNTVFRLNAITQLLVGYNVTIKGRYGISFNDSNEKQYIREVSDEYAAYELVTAMQIFRTYGRGQELVAYLNKQPSTSERDKKLVSAIQKASDGIRLSNIIEFRDAINIIADLKSEFGDSMKTDMDIVFQEICKEYGSLLEKPNSNHMEYVKWCLAKGFLQQAMTIIESQIPSDLVTILEKDELEKVGSIISVRFKKQEVIKLDKDKWEDDDKGDYPICVARENGMTIEKFVTKSGLKQKWQHMSNWLLEEWAKQSITKQKNMALDGNILESWKEACCNLNTEETDEYTIKYTYVTDKEMKKAGVRKRGFTLYIHLKKEIVKEIRYFVKLHMALKEQRNKINHSAGEEIVPITYLEDAVKAYIQIGEVIGL